MKTAKVPINVNASEREAFFIQLYKQVFPIVAKYVSKKGGSFEEAKDIFQEALVIYYEHTTVSSALPPKDEKAYVVGIAKHLWSKRFQEAIVSCSLEAPLAFMQSEEEEEVLPSENKLMHLLETTGRKCMDLLKAFYYDKLSISELTTVFGYGSVRSTTVQKYKCLESVRQTIKEKELHYENFLN